MIVNMVAVAAAIAVERNCTDCHTPIIIVVVLEIWGRTLRKQSRLRLIVVTVIFAFVYGLGLPQALLACLLIPPQHVEVQLLALGCLQRLLLVPWNTIWRRGSSRAKLIRTDGSCHSLPSISLSQGCFVLAISNLAAHRGLLVRTGIHFVVEVDLLRNVNDLELLLMHHLRLDFFLDAFFPKGIGTC